VAWSLDRPEFSEPNFELSHWKGVGSYVREQKPVQADLLQRQQPRRRQTAPAAPRGPQQTPSAPAAPPLSKAAAPLVVREDTRIPVRAVEGGPGGGTPVKAAPGRSGGGARRPTPRQAAVFPQKESLQVAWLSRRWTSSDYKRADILSEFVQERGKDSSAPLMTRRLRAPISGGSA